MDTMETTKIVGAACGALLVFLVLAWGAETIYHVGGGHGDHGEEHVSGYPIEVEVADDAGADEEEVIDIAALIASADLGKGEKVFKKCAACHKLEDGANGVGPHLYGIVGRGIGAIGGFGYSDALAGLTADAWDAEALSGFLEKPKSWAPGTKMSFNGLKKPEDRANLIAYLDSLDD